MPGAAAADDASRLTRYSLQYKLICAMIESMSRAARFVFLLVAGLGLLTWGGMLAVKETTRRWFDNDVSLRADLAVRGSRSALLTHWRAQHWRSLRNVLVEMAHDERIMAAAACSAQLKFVARTPDFPDRFRCAEIAPRLAAPAPGAQPGSLVAWRSTADLPGGKVHLSALPIEDDAGKLGFVLLLHDMSYVERREQTLRGFLLVAFVVLSLGASITTAVASRLSWRSWSQEVRRLLKGGAHRPEFGPVMRDVRELVERLAYERELETGGTWTPQRLKHVLERHLKGERVVIVANREPYIHQARGDGSVSVLHPASGLVTALEPVMRACSGVWVAHGGGSADRETADRHGRIGVPPEQPSYTLRRVWLSPEEEQGYYYGLANEGLWPLCHNAHTRPVFRLDDWRYYQLVNKRFADAVCAEVDTDDPIVLVQDYHFALVPQLVRHRLPRATIITFWHIPWPHAEAFGISPWRDELLKGLLGSSIMGFHTQLHCNNFVDAVDRYLEARIDRERTAVVQGPRTTLVRAYPISIEWPSRWGSDTPTARECRSRVFADLGLRPNALLGVGVDRLDYTKGIEERLLAVERLLQRFPSLRGRFTFAQLAAPSRTAIERYQQLNEAVEALAARINARFGSDTYRPIVLLRAHHEPPTVFRYYRAADLCYVSSLHDGMNLVAKEFVCARDDERGVLVLSQFTGAARELPEALIVNPYDLEEASDALAGALNMPVSEQAERMRAMRALISEFNVYRWAGRMLVDAARLRRRERLSGRLNGEAQPLVAEAT
jgi:trehalose 6-phosphate synthase